MLHAWQHDLNLEPAGRKRAAMAVIPPIAHQIEGNWLDHSGGRLPHQVPGVGVRCQPSLFTDREMFLYWSLHQQRKEVIQCLIQSAVTSLRPPARLIASLAKGALGAWTSEKRERAHRISGAPFLLAVLCVALSGFRL